MQFYEDILTQPTSFASVAVKSPRIASKACICSGLASWYLFTKP